MSTQFLTIIPYFQREPGILRKAVASALAQEVPNQILVVDDGSPVSAQSELTSASFGDDKRVTIIETANGGAARARNVGLDNRPAGVAAIAFLDSDDVWAPEHLGRAQAALEQGFDFYFADHRRDHWPTGKFERHHFAVVDHPEVPGLPGLREFCGSLGKQVFLKHIVQTSTVVLRVETVPHLRFPVDLRLFEDDITWARLGQTGAKVCFSETIDALLGKGVNISLAEEWGSQSAIAKNADLLFAWGRIFDYLEQDAEITEVRALRMRSLRKDLARQCIARAFSDRQFPCSAENARHLIRGFLELAIDKISGKTNSVWVRK